jgi:hypothetical protein
MMINTALENKVSTFPGALTVQVGSLLNAAAN